MVIFEAQKSHTFQEFGLFFTPKKCVVIIHFTLENFLHRITQQNFTRLIGLIKRITSATHFMLGHLR